MNHIETKPRLCFEVEKVLGISSDGTYQVQWAPAWVSKFHLVGCEHLIQDFLQNQQVENVMNVAQSDAPTSQQQHEDSGEYDENSYGSDPSGLSCRTECGKNGINRQYIEVDNVRVKIENTIDEEFEYQQWQPPEDIDEHVTENLSSLSYNPEHPERVTSQLDTDENDNHPNEVCLSSEENHTEPQVFLQKNKMQDSNNAEGLPNMNQCVICLVDVRRKEVRKHMKVFHNVEERPWLCPYCKKGFAKSHDMTVHVRSHTGEKPHECDICGKSFAQIGSLNRHRRWHAGVERHACTKCGKFLTNTSALRRHVTDCRGRRDDNGTDESSVSACSDSNVCLT